MTPGNWERLVEEMASSGWWRRWAAEGEGYVRQR